MLNNQLLSLLFKYISNAKGKGKPTGVPKKTLVLLMMFMSSRRDPRTGFLLLLMKGRHFALSLKILNVSTVRIYAYRVPAYLPRCDAHSQSHPSIRPSELLQQPADSPVFSDNSAPTTWTHPTSREEFKLHEAEVPSYPPLYFQSLKMYLAFMRCSTSYMMGHESSLQVCYRLLHDGVVGELSTTWESEWNPMDTSCVQKPCWPEQKKQPAIHGNHQELQRNPSLDVFKQKMKNNVGACGRGEAENHIVLYYRGFIFSHFFLFSVHIAGMKWLVFISFLNKRTMSLL